MSSSSPEPELAVVPSGRPAAWGSVLRSALLFIPFLAVTLAIFVYILDDLLAQGAGVGRVFGVIASGGVALLLAFQVVQAIRDLFSSLVETTGVVERRWSRNEFFIMRNDYIFVGRSVYRIEPLQAVEIKTGDTVRIVHYPHTCTVETVEVVQRADRVEER